MSLRALQIGSVLLALAAAVPLVAQLQIDRFPQLPQPAVEENKKPEKPPTPVYSGENVALPIECKTGKLEYSGILCSPEQPCVLYLDLAAIAAEGDFVVAAGELHSNESTLESVVLSSADGGKTWKEAAERVPAAGIEAVEIVDGGYAWAAGQQGDAATVEKPFTLYTGDYGESWSLRKLGDAEDPIRGVVVDFRLDSAEHGYIILEQLSTTGDPFQMRETYNGGRSWDIRQITAERPKIPGGRFLRTPEQMWRLREDSGAWRIERRSDAEPGGWALSTSFLVEAGSCPNRSAAPDDLSSAK